MELTFTSHVHHFSENNQQIFHFLSGPPNKKMTSFPGYAIALVTILPILLLAGVVTVILLYGKRHKILGGCITSLHIVHSQPKVNGAASVSHTLKEVNSLQTENVFPTGTDLQNEPCTPLGASNMADFSTTEHSLG